MQVNPATSTSVSSAYSDRFAKLKKSFESLSEALKSGNLADAQQALEQIQTATPSGQASNPLSDKLAQLSDAIDSGDIAKAQDVFAGIQKDFASRRQAAAAGAGSQGRPAGGRGGHPHGDEGASGTSTASDSTQQTYDPRDTNKDGTVTLQEQLSYSLNATQDPLLSSNTSNSQPSNGFDAFA